MASLSTKLFNFTARRIIRPLFVEFDIKKIRRLIERFDGRISDPKGLLITTDKLSNCEVDWVSAENERSDRVILYLPGGAWVLRSRRGHRRIVARLARAAKARACMVCYRLAPEHPFPAPLDDCIEAYQNLLAQNIPPSRIVIGGDSAGGHLTLALLLALRDRSIQMPAAAFGLSPATDMRHTEGGSRSSDADPLFPIASDHGDKDPRRMFVGGDEAMFDHPYVSPIVADPTGLCPLLLQVGGTEVLRDDAIRFVASAKATGVAAEVEIWEGQPHVWHALFFPESSKAIDHISDFIRQNTP